MLHRFLQDTVLPKSTVPLAHFGVKVLRHSQRSDAEKPHRNASRDGASIVGKRRTKDQQSHDVLHVVQQQNSPNQKGFLLKYCPRPLRNPKIATMAVGLT
jgi:hypothetical protein